MTLSSDTHAAAFAIAQAADVPAGHLMVHRWYLRRDTSPVAVPASPEGATVMRAESCTVAFYRFLYDTVGKDWLWAERRRDDDATIRETTDDPRVHVDVLYMDGTPAGFVQTDHRDRGETEIAYVGLMPGFTGAGLGTFMVADAMARALRKRAVPLTINTCTLDSAGGLALYMKLGFAVEREIDFAWPDPRLDGTIPRDAAPHVPLAT